MLGFISFAFLGNKIVTKSNKIPEVYFNFPFPFHFKAISSGVTCSPDINVFTTTYENKFKKLENQTCPYDSVDIHPKFGNVVFLIVGLNDYTEITKSK